MVIQLRSIAGMRLDIYPDPAVVHVGDRIEWQLQLVAAQIRPFAPQGDPFRLGPVKWTIYFSHEQPIAGHRELSSSATPEQLGTIDFGSAESPGDYKYGIRLIDAAGEPISDDDPFLIVLP